MPELPEVESIKLQLEKYVVGHKIESTDISSSKIFLGEKSLVNGARVIKVRRFGKVLSIDLSNGSSILIHVKLTGQIIYRGVNLLRPQLSKKIIGGVPGKHTHVIFNLDKKSHLYYNDVRQFGWIKVIKTKDVESSGFIGKLGPEPLKNLLAKDFRNILSKSARPIKVLIMDQEKIAGVGNIYANDALWDAKIDPKRKSNSLSDSECVILYKSIEKVLKEGLKRGGASELAFVTPDGSEGHYQDFTLVYGREGKPCKRCGAEIKKYFLGGRGTYICANCQR